MNSATRRYWMSQSQFGSPAGRQLSGYSSFGTGTKATLKIGRKAGLDYAGWRTGQAISEGQVLAVVVKRRADQIGSDAVGMSATSTKGRYKGKREPSVNIEIAWTQTPRKETTRGAFFRNMKALAQGVASDLAQREVIVEWDAPGRRGRIDTATPKAAPATANNKRFCAWVRENSQPARLARSKAEANETSLRV